MSQIFISHSSKDRDFAKQMAAWLCAEGYESFFLDFDPDHGFAAGQRWEDEIFRNLRLCRAVIALVSPNWFGSRWCFAEAILAREKGKPLFCVLVSECSDERIFAEIEHVDLTIDPSDAYKRLAKGLKLVVDPESTFTWDQSRPLYPGLFAFEEEDAAIFFGRDQEIHEALELLNSLRHTRDSGLVIAVGASGSGKSSLVRAGVIPRLRKRRDIWLCIAPFRPQRNPMEELAAALAAAFDGCDTSRHSQSIYEELFAPYSESEWSDLSTPLISGEGLVKVVRDLRAHANKPNLNVLVTVDQLEELFTYSDKQSARAFLQCLRGAMALSGNRVMGLATMRSDALTDFQTHPDLQGYGCHWLAVPSIPIRDLAKIIEGPASLAELAFDPGLVQMLVEDASTSDALPLLAFTLGALYERCRQAGRIGDTDYERIGRLEGSVRRRADLLVEPVERDPTILSALQASFVPGLVQVTEDGKFVRRRTSWSTLPSSAHTLLQSFVESRLLVSRGELGERTVEIAHEALLRKWPRLELWLHEDTDVLRTYDELRRAAKQWELYTRKDAWLVHHGQRLQAAEVVMRSDRFASNADVVLEDYLAACIAKQRAGELRALSAQSAALAMLSRQQTSGGFATLGMLLALSGLPKDQRAEDRPLVAAAESALFAAIVAQREEHLFAGHSAPVNDIHFSRNGKLMVSASADTTARIWDISDGRSKAVLRGHSGQIYWAEFGVDGASVITASADGTAKVWDTDTGILLATLSGHDSDVFVARFSSDGQSILTASADRTARVWRSNEPGRIHPKWVLRGHTDGVPYAEFSANALRIVTASEDHTARLWDTTSGACLATLEGHHAPVYRAIFSPNGQRIVTGSWDGTARLWDSHTGSTIVTLKGHNAGVTSTDFSDDGSLILTGSADGSARLWRGSNGEPVHVLDGHEGAVHDARLSPSGKLAVTVGEDATARLWNVLDGEPIDLFCGHIGKVWAGRFSPDGKHVATASEDNTCSIWTVASSRSIKLRVHTKQVNRVAFSPDGQRVVTASEDGTAALHRSDGGKRLAVLQGHEGPVWYAVFSSNGKLIVTTGADGAARVWSALDGRPICTLKGHDGYVHHAHFSPAGRRLITAGAEGTAKVWEVPSGNVLATLQTHQGAVYFAEFSPDELRIVTAAYDGASLWDGASYEFLGTLTGHGKQVINGAFSPDSAKLLTTSWDATARIWDTKSGNPLLTLSGHTAPVLAGSFSSHATLIATASSDNTARIWDGSSATCLFELKAHTGEVSQVQFSADARLIMTASADGTARLWHTATGSLVASFKGHTDRVSHACFSPTQQQIATASWDCSAILWTLPLAVDQDWIAYARASVPRELTDLERRRFINS